MITFAEQVRLAGHLGDMAAGRQPGRARTGPRGVSTGERLEVLARLRDLHPELDLDELTVRADEAVQACLEAGLIR